MIDDCIPVEIRRISTAPADLVEEWDRSGAALTGLGGCLGVLRPMLDTKTLLRLRTTCKHIYLKSLDAEIAKHLILKPDAITPSGLKTPDLPRESPRPHAAWRHWGAISLSVRLRDLPRGELDVMLKGLPVHELILDTTAGQQGRIQLSKLCPSLKRLTLERSESSIKCRHMINLEGLKLDYLKLEGSDLDAYNCIGIPSSGPNELVINGAMNFLTDFLGKETKEAMYGIKRLSIDEESRNFSDFAKSLQSTEINLSNLTLDWLELTDIREEGTTLVVPPTAPEHMVLRGTATVLNLMKMKEPLFANRAIKHLEIYDVSLDSDVDGFATYGWTEKVYNPKMVVDLSELDLHSLKLSCIDPGFGIIAPRSIREVEITDVFDGRITRELLAAPGLKRLSVNNYPDHFIKDIELDFELDLTNTALEYLYLSGVSGVIKPPLVSPSAMDLHNTAVPIPLKKGIKRLAIDDVHDRCLDLSALDDLESLKLICSGPDQNIIPPPTGPRELDISVMHKVPAGVAELLTKAEGTKRLSIDGIYAPTPPLDLSHLALDTLTLSGIRCCIIPPAAGPVELHVSDLHGIPDGLVELLARPDIKRLALNGIYDKFNQLDLSGMRLDDLTLFDVTCRITPPKTRPTVEEPISRPIILSRPTTFWNKGTG